MKEYSDEKKSPLNQDSDWLNANVNLPSKRKNGFALFAFGAIVVSVAAGVVWLQMRHGGTKLVVEKCCDDILLGPKTALFVRAKTEVRTKPSFKDGRTAYSLNRGATVSGEVVLGPDGRTRWLKQDGDGWFVLTRDLSTGAAPRLTGLALEQSSIAPSNVEIRQIPDAKAPVLVTLPAGTPMTLIGYEKGGFAEITFEHPTYRVGYLMGLQGSAP